MNSQHLFDTMNSIIYFQETLKQNIKKESKYKVGFTMISIQHISKTNWLNQNKTKEINKFVLIYPFIGENCEYTYLAPSYINTTDNHNMRDFCCSVDESFYHFLYEEMKKRNNLIIGKIIGETWEIYDDDIVQIHHEKEDIINESFEEWYKNGVLNVSDYTIEITNPYLYSVPYPLYSLKYKLTDSSPLFLDKRDD